MFSRTRRVESTQSAVHYQRFPWECGAAAGISGGQRVASMGIWKPRIGAFAAALACGKFLKHGGEVFLTVVVMVKGFKLEYAAWGEGERNGLFWMLCMRSPIEHALEKYRQMRILYVCCEGCWAGYCGFGKAGGMEGVGG